MPSTPMSNLMSDKNHLRSFFYDTAEKLKIRLFTWNEYGQNKTSFFTWIRKGIPLNSATKRFLDVGCGTGQLLAESARALPGLEVSGVDLSPAMVNETRGNLSKDATIVVGDAEALPFSDSRFDAVSAIHMLYHVPHQTEAIKELLRVTKKNGVVFITTTEYDVHSGLNKLHYEGLKKFNFPEFMQDASAYLRFTPERARSLLAGIVGHVDELFYKNDVHFPSVESALSYYQSAMMYRQSLGVDDPRIESHKWELLYSDVKQSIEKKMTENGFFLMPSTVVAFRIHK